MKKIDMSHGSGGERSQELIKEVFIKAFGYADPKSLDDAALIEKDLAFTTDSFVVYPLFFPGGDIGKLSICGTVNDLAVKGAIPLYISASFIIGEGFDIEKLKKISLSMAKEAKLAGVKIVTGDTKIINSKEEDTLYITTSGIGKIPKGINISSTNAKPGDKIILSGNIAEHGVAIMNARNDFGFSGILKSDCTPLNEVIQSFVGKQVHVMRDPTRGGVASSLNEIASSSKVGIIIDEEKIPVSAQTKQACALLGLDPLHIANEGKFIAFVSKNYADKALTIIKKHPLGKNAQIIGEVVSGKGVFVKTGIGGMRPLYMLDGEQLPRIC